MQRLSFLLLVCAAIIVTSGCATHKFVRNQVKTSSDTLTARIETNEGQIKEVQDSADKKVAGVETKVADLDTRTSAQFNSVRTDVQAADQKASNANTAAEHAAAGVSTLDQKFQNRNQFNTMDEKSVLFKFNSGTLEPTVTCTAWLPSPLGELTSVELTDPLGMPLSAARLVAAVAMEDEELVCE